MQTSVKEGLWQRTFAAMLSTFAQRTQVKPLIKPYNLTASEKLLVLEKRLLG